MTQLSTISDSPALDRALDPRTYLPPGTNHGPLRAVFAAPPWKSGELVPYEVAAAPTQARPGTDEKGDILAARYHYQIPLWDDGDATCRDDGRDEYDPTVSDLDELECFNEGDAE